MEMLTPSHAADATRAALPGKPAHPAPEPAKAPVAKRKTRPVRLSETRVDAADDSVQTRKARHLGAGETGAKPKPLSVPGSQVQSHVTEQAAERREEQRQESRAATHALAPHIEPQHHEINYRIVPGLDRVQTRRVDRDDQHVVRTTPTEKQIAIAKKFKEVTGAHVDIFA